jgi:DNA topoisomerase-1
MSDLALGTKSTRAEIIQKLYRRNYIEGQKAIAPTKIAFAVVDSLQKHKSVVVKPEMTANLEVVGDSRQLLSNALLQLLENKNEIGSAIRNAARADSIFGPCSGQGCKGELLVRRGRTGKRFLGCTAYPKCTVTFPLPQKGLVNVLPEKCGDCSNIMIKVIGKRYRYKMCIDPKCKSKEGWGKKKEEAKAGKESLEKKEGEEGAKPRKKDQAEKEAEARQGKEKLEEKEAARPTEKQGKKKKPVAKGRKSGKVKQKRLKK